MLDNIRLIVGYFRGQSGITFKQAAKAMLALLNTGLDNVPDSPPVLTAGPQSVTDPEGVITRLESVLHAQHDHQQAMIALPWAQILPILAQLLANWASGLKA